MWDQKKGTTPQVYPSLYGQPSGAGQLPQTSLQQQYQSMSHYPPSMAQAQMTQAMAGQMAQGLGPPPPYSPYPDHAQQQMKYMSQMGYNPNQYLPNTTGSMTAPSFVPQSQSSMSSMGAIGGAHPTYASAYASNPYAPSLYNPYSPYSNHALASNPTVVMPQGFDAGARFDGIARPNIPQPPPPGVAANAAQMAAMQGHNVVIGKKNSSFLEGGSSGGYTFW